jgi:hypothetical protein
MSIEELAIEIMDRPGWALHPELVNRSWLRYLVDLRTKLSYVAIVGQYLDFHARIVGENPQFVDGVGLLDPLETVIIFFESRNAETVVIELYEIQLAEHNMLRVVHW